MGHYEKIITDRIVILDDLHSRHEEPAHLIPEDALIAYKGRKWCVIREGGTFHLSPVDLHVYNDPSKGYVIHELSDYHGELYRPIHSTVTFEDVEGATFAWDDGTHFHFAHCSKREQAELSEQVRTFAEAQFFNAIHGAQIKAIEATGVAKQTAIEKTKALVKFANAVGFLARETILAQTLGHWHREDLEPFSYVTYEAINAVLKDWKQKGLSDSQIVRDRAAVSAAAVQVKADLGTRRTFEFRGVRAARLEAEKKKKAAATETPTDSTQDSNHEHGD